MAHLHLPEDHTDTDLILAGQIAASMRSRELYIAWTHSGGAGAQPAVAAQLREPAGAATELVEILVDFAAAVWRALTRATAPSSVGRVGS
jgi:hypothetical protein